MAQKRKEAAEMLSVSIYYLFNSPYEPVVQLFFQALNQANLIISEVRETHVW